MKKGWSSLVIASFRQCVIGYFVIASLVIASLVMGFVLVACSPRHIKTLDAAPIEMTTSASDSILSESKVVVDLCVDQKGDVISAAYNAEKSTTTDTSLTNSALRMVHKYKFEPAKERPLQCGIITFNFKLK